MKRQPVTIERALILSAHAQKVVLIVGNVGGTNCGGNIDVSYRKSALFVRCESVVEAKVRRCSYSASLNPTRGAPVLELV